MKITIKGFVQAVTPVLTKLNGNTTFRIQSLIIMIPGYQNEFGEKVGKDETWQVDITNDQIEKHNLSAKNIDGKKIEVNAYLNSRTYKKDGADAYALQIRLADYKLLN